MSTPSTPATTANQPKEFPKETGPIADEAIGPVSCWDCEYIEPDLEKHQYCGHPRAPWPTDNSINDAADCPGFTPSAAIGLPDDFRPTLSLGQLRAALDDFGLPGAPLPQPELWRSLQEHWAYYESTCHPEYKPVITDRLELVEAKFRQAQ